MTADPDILDYLDYRDYLRDLYESRKTRQSSFSYRYMASKLGVDPAYLVKVLQSRKHLAVDCFPAACHLCGLDALRSRYLLELAVFAKARGDTQLRSSFDRLMALKGQGVRALDDRHSAFLGDWHHHAIRSLVGIVDVRDDYAALGRMLSPPVSARDAKASILVLESLGMIERIDERWRLTDRFVSSGRNVDPRRIHGFQRATLQLAEEALNRHPPDLRNVSTVTVALSRSRMGLLSERIREFRQEILRLAQAEDAADAVYQLNIQLFPLAFAETTG